LPPFDAASGVAQDRLSFAPRNDEASIGDETLGLSRNSIGCDSRQPAVNTPQAIRAPELPEGSVR
jgi:hypothetical protein